MSSIASPTYYGFWESNCEVCCVHRLEPQEHVVGNVMVDCSYYNVEMELHVHLDSASPTLSSCARRVCNPHSWHDWRGLDDSSPYRTRSWHLFYGCTFIASTATTTTTTTYNLTRMVCTWCETSFTTAENDQEATTCRRHTSPTKQDIGIGSTSRIDACQCRVPPLSLSLCGF